MKNCFARCVRPRSWLVWVLFALPVVSCAQTVAAVGFSAISIHDPVNGGSTPGYVFYPSVQAKGVTWRGPYELHATADAPVIPGTKPLVVISHGHGGSDLGHHDLATYLASRGFVVATLEHPKDNFHDASGNGHLTVFAGRPIQVKATTSYLLADPHWRKLIDANRIGVVGFSMGGYTSLLLVGAVPHFDLITCYCKRHPGDQETCSLARQLPAQAHMTEKDYLGALQKGLYRWGNTDDPRIKAAFVMAPTSFVFDRAGLATVNRPVFLYYGQNDPVLLPAANVLHIGPLIQTLAGIKMIPKAEHYVFLSPCSPQLAKAAPDICRDPAGVDRTKVHAQINADALAFFRKTLVALPPDSD